MTKSLMQALEPYRPMFFEEPLLPQHNDALPELARHTAVPLATGERMFTRWDFKALLASGGVDVVQPDLSHTGGIWEARKIAAMAEAYDVAVAPGLGIAIDEAKVRAAAAVGHRWRSPL